MISDVALFSLMEKELETFEGFMGKNDIFVVGMINAEVVTFVAGSLEAGGLPGSLEIPEVLK